MPEPKETIPVTVDVRVKSLNPSRSSLRLIELIDEHKDKLRARLSAEFKDVEITDLKVVRQPAFSIGVDAIATAFMLGVAGGIGKPIGEKIGGAIIAWVEETFHDADIIQLDLSKEGSDSASA